MHQSIYIGVNNKMQVTQQLKSQFESFTQEFWDRIKENVQQNAELKRKVDSLTIQQKRQGQQLQKSTKDLSRFNLVTTNLDQKIDQQVRRVMKTMSLDFQKTNEQLQQRRQEIDKLIEKISQSKALLDSKSKLVDQLLEDLGLYKFQKKAIDQKLDHLFDEITMRIHKTQFYQMRKYFDGIIQQQKIRNDDRFSKLQHIISQNNKQQHKQNKNIYDVIRNLRQQTQSNLKKNEIQSLQRHNCTSQRIQKCLTQLQESLNQLQMKQSERILANLNEIIELQMTTKTHTKNIQVLNQLTKSHSQHINQVQSNILSINERITGIQQQNARRQSQLSKLQQTSENSGDLSSRLGAVVQSIMQIRDVVSNVQEKITGNFKQFTKNKRETDQAIQQLQKSIQDQRKVLNLRLQEVHQIISQNQKSLEENITQTERKSIQHIDNTIFSIKSKLDNLEEVSRNVNEFKVLFEKQMIQTEQVNKNLKEKIEMISSALVKQKSDSSIKIERVAKQVEKKGDIIKNVENTIEEFKVYFSQLSQTLNVCICAELWSASLSQPVYQPFKVSSMRDGWVLQIESRQKIRYRGQYLPRTKILQLTIDNFVKINDKLKGSTILDSGKQVFQKILDANLEIGGRTSRVSGKRSVSRRRQSQLPKLYK